MKPNSYHLIEQVIAAKRRRGTSRELIARLSDIKFWQLIIFDNYALVFDFGFSVHRTFIASSCESFKTAIERWKIFSGKAITRKFSTWFIHKALPMYLYSVGMALSNLCTFTSSIKYMTVYDVKSSLQLRCEKFAVDFFGFRFPEQFQPTCCLIVVIKLLNRFVIFDVCACLSSALWGILETGLPGDFLGWRGKLKLAWRVWWYTGGPAELCWYCSLFLIWVARF